MKKKLKTLLYCVIATSVFAAPQTTDVTLEVDLYTPLVVTEAYSHTFTETVDASFDTHRDSLNMGAGSHTPFFYIDGELGATVEWAIGDPNVMNSSGDYPGIELTGTKDPTKKWYLGVDFILRDVDSPDTSRRNQGVVSGSIRYTRAYGGITFANSSYFDHNEVNGGIRSPFLDDPTEVYTGTIDYQVYYK